MSICFCLGPYIMQYSTVTPLGFTARDSDNQTRNCSGALTTYVLQFIFSANFLVLFPETISLKKWLFAQAKGTVKKHIQ